LIAASVADPAPRRLFQRLEHFQDLADVAFGESAHHRALGRYDLDQALAGQRLDRFAQRRSRDAERGADLAFVDPRAWRQGALDDHVADLVQHGIMQGNARDARHAAQAFIRALSSGRQPSLPVLQLATVCRPRPRLSLP
jgi:hypothetical protein